MKKIFTILLVTMLLLLSGQSLRAQLANLPCTGYNADVVANGAGAAGTSTTADVDGVAWVFVDNTFAPAGTVCNTTNCWPASNTISSLITTGLTYTLQSPSVNNSLRLSGSANGTLVLTTPTKCSNLYVLATGGSGSCTVTATVYFSDGTNEVTTGLSVADWCAGTSPASPQFYRIQTTNSASCTGGLCQYMYQVSIPVSATGQTKNITSVNFANTGGVLNVFSMGGYTLNSPYLSALPASLSFGYVAFGNSSTAQSFVLNGGVLTSNGLITVTAPAGFSICLSSGGTYTTSIPISYTGNTLPATTIYAKFTPTAANTAYSGNITAAGGGATTLNIPVSGTSSLVYCASNATSTADEEILNVSLGTLNNSSTCSTTAPDPGSILNEYSNYTVSVAPPTLLATQSYTLSVQIGTCGGTYSNMTGVWIDFNQNGTFDAGEQVYISPTYTSGPHTETATITIPANALAGNTRMRVVTVETTVATGVIACGTYTWGETEDYTVTIAMPTSPYFSITPLSNNFNYVIFGSSSAAVAYTISGANLTGGSGIITVAAPTGFQVCATSNGSYQSSIPITYSGSTLSLTTFYVKFIPTAANTSYSGNITFNGGGATGTSSVQGTSSLIYCTSASEYSTYDNISNVNFGGINNSSGGSTYTNYTVSVAPAQIIQGISTPLSITIGGTLYSSGSTNYCRAWIDYNQDGVFDPVTEQVYSGTYTTSGTVLTGNVTIPYTSLGGPTRMRIICDYYYAPSPCWLYGTSLYYYGGETEDYTINVIPAVPCVAPTAQATALVLTPSFTTVAGSFTASSSADHYLIVRSTSSTLGALPVNVVNYTVGQNLGSGFVVGYQTGTTFTDVNLNLGTPYYYWVFAANSLCLNGPVYQTSNPLTGNATTSSLANALNGVYTINSSLPTAGTNFNSFASANQALNLQGVNGPVTFNVAAGTYTDHMDLLPVVGATSTNKIIFQSASNNNSSVTLQYAATGPTDNYLVRFNGAQYITFKAMTVQATNATYANTITFANGANNISVLNNVIIGTQSAYTDSNQMSTRLYYGSNYSNITIDHNVYNYGVPSLHFFTPSGSNPNIVITYNTFTNAATNNNNCVKIARCDGINFGNNNITVVAGSAANCLWFDYLVGLWKIHDNVIKNLGTGIGLSAWYANSGVGVGQEALIYNNYVYTVGTTWGTDLCGMTYINYYYNTFVSSSTSATFHFGNYYGTWTNCIFKNNVVYNTGAGPLLSIAAASGSGTNPVNLTLDYNDYYTTNASPYSYLSTTYTTLAAFQTASSQEAHSIWANPNFIATGDFHITNTALIAGTPLAAVTTDLDGQTRASLPTIGADEVPPCVAPTNQASAFVFSPSYLYIFGNFSVSPDADHYLIIRSTSSSLTATPVNGTYYSAGTPFGTNGYVVGYQTGNSFTDNGLNPATQYYYFVFAANSLCSGGPLYLTLNPLSQSVNTLTPASIHSIANGLWSNPSTWSTGTVPAFMDSVFVDSTYNVHLDIANDSCYNLVVYNGGLLDATGTIGVLNIGGTILNNGAINMYVDSADYSTINFVGMANSLYTGNGTNNINQFTIGKVFSGAVTVSSPTVELNLTNLTIRGAVIDTLGFINTSKYSGIFKMSGTNSFSSRLFSTAAYTIPTTGGIWMNNPNFNVAGMNGSPTMNGLLRVTQGTYNVGTAIDNTMTVGGGSILMMEGGSLSSTGKLYNSTAATFNMSAGTIKVSTIGNTSGSGAFEYMGGNTSTSPILFSMSGGTIIVQNANSGTGNKIDVRFPIPTASNYNITGGTVQLGNNLTQASQQFFCLDGKFWNVLIDTTTAQHGTKNYAALTILNSFTNPGTGATYLGYGASGYALTVTKTFSTKGQVIGNLSTGCAVVFNGTTAQTFTAANTSILGTITMNNASGVTITPAIANYGLILNAGILNCPTGTLRFGDSTANTFTLTKGFGNLTTSTAPTFNFNNMTTNYNMNDTVALVGTPINNLFPAISVGTVSALTLNNAKGLTLTKSLNVGTLALTSGKINTSTFVLTVKNTATTAITGYSATNFIYGTLSRALPASTVNTGNWVYPIGTVSAAADTILYNPFTIINPSTGTNPYVKVSVIKGNFSSATPGLYLQSVNNDRRWNVVLDSGIFNYGRVMVYDTSINSTMLLGRCATANGSFVGLLSTLGTFTYTTIDSLTAIAPYWYAIGVKKPMSYVSSTTTQTNTASVTQGTYNQQILGVQIVTLGSANPIVLSQINFNTNGTTITASDISNIKLFSTGTSATFATTTVIDSTVNFSNGTFTLNPSTIIPFYLVEGTNNFWLTYDINPNATNNDVVDAQCVSITVDGIPRTPTIGNPFGNRTIFSGTGYPNMKFLSTTAFQPVLTAVVAGNTNQQVLTLKVVSQYPTLPLSVNSFILGTTGSTNALTDIDSAKIYYTGTTNTFATTTLYGTAIAGPNGTFTINGSQVLTGTTGGSVDTNYFFLVYNIKSSAVSFDSIDAIYNQINVSGTTYNPVLSAPAGNRLVRSSLNGIYTIDNSLPPIPISTNNYTSFVSAVSDLNTLGISGPVTFNVKAGEIFPMACSTTNPFGIKITATGTAANPIVFQRNGTGNNPLLTIIGSTATTDAAIWINGGDYITFDGIDIKDTAITTTAYVEYGVYLNGAATNGCQYNTFKNSTITLTNTTSNTAIRGIYLVSTATSAAGRNIYNKFYNNTINKAFYGAQLTGIAGFYDVKNEIGTINSGRSVIKNIGTGGAYASHGVNFSYQDSLQVFNTLIDSVKSTSGLIGIQIAAASSNFNWYGDTISNIIGTENYGLNFAGASAGTNFMHHCVVKNFIATGGNVNVFRDEGSSLGTMYIYNNEFTNITNSGTANGIEGLYLNSASTFYIYNNRFYNFNESYSGGACWANTINLMNASNVSYIYNNYISDISCAGGTSSPTTVGIRIQNTTTAKVYNNTVFLSYTGANASNISVCLFAAATPTSLDMRNNIFINKCNMTTGTRAVPFWWPSTTYTNIAATSNNNLYYTVPSPTTKNPLFYDGTNSPLTIAAYQTLMGSKDQLSFSDTIPFVNDGIKPYDLHVKTTTANNRAESHGQRITTPIAVKTDFDDDIRFGETGYQGTGAQPDLGADEFNGTTIDDIPPSIVFTALPNSTSVTGVFLNNVNITAPLNHVNTSNFKPRVYFKKSTAANDSLHWHWVEPLASSNAPNFNFYLDYSILQNTDTIFTGNTVQYFIIAQDSNSTVNVGKTAGLSGIVTSVKLLSTNLTVTSPSSFNVSKAINGIYYVGTRVGDNYTSLSSASGFFSDVNSNIVTGNVTVKVTTNTAETGANQLNVLTTEGVGGYSINIVPIDTATVQKVMTGGYAGGLIRVAASNVIFDGARNGVGNYLQLFNTTGGATYYTIQMISGANNCTFKNIYIKGPDYQVVSTVYHSGGNISNLSFINDSITNCLIALSINGASGSTVNNLVIKGTTFGTDLGGQKVHTNAMNLSYINGLTVDSCTFNIWTLNTNTATPRAIYLNAQVTNANITRNNFIRVQGQYASGSYGAAAIELNTGNAASNITIANNQIKNVVSAGTTAWTTYAVAGIKLLGTTGGVKIYNNSVNMYGSANQFYTAGNTQQYNAGIYVASTVTGLDIRNNIIKNIITSTAATTSRSFAIYSDAPASAFTNIDYNLYYTTGTQGMLAYIVGNDTTLNQLRTATTRDVHSLFADPIYTSNTNLTPNNCPTSPAIGSGTSIAAVTTDIVNTSRSLQNSTIGAYEMSYAKKMIVSAILQEYYTGLGLPIMTPTYDMDPNSGDMYIKFTSPVVDTVQLLIVNPATMDPYNIEATAEYTYNGMLLNTDGTITPQISLPISMTGFRYIVINHRNSIQTWSDSVNFSCLAINYNFFAHPVSTLFPGNMLPVYNGVNYVGSLIWGGDVGDLYTPNRDGVVNIFDLSAVFDAINDPSGVFSAGYSPQDVNGDGVVNIYDLSMIFDNINAGASSVNPGTLKKKK